MSLIHGAEDNVVEIGYIILITVIMAIALLYSKRVFCSSQVGGVKSKSNLKTHIGENLVLKWINNDYSFEVAVNQK
jgi:hypothetical protein